MSTIENIVKNTSFLLVGRLSTKIISFFILLYIARYLGPDDFGKFSFVFAFVYFFAFIPDLGIHNILVREAAKEPANAGILIGNATAIKIVLSLIAIFLAFFTINLMDYPISTKNALYLASIGLLITNLSAFGIIYEIKLRMEYSALFSVTSRIIFLMLVLYGVLQNSTLLFFVFASISADFVHNILMVVFSKRFVNVQFNFDYKLIKQILHEALPIALASVFVMIYFRVDILMLSFLKNDVDVGLYSAAYRFTEAFIFVPSILMTSMFPLMSKYFKESFNLFVYSYVKSFKYLFASGLILAIIVSFLADVIILKVYGLEYSGSISALQILIWATSIMFINILLSFTYISSGNQGVMAKLTAFAAFFNIALNFIFIPSFSYNGAAISTMITELVVMVFGIYWINKNICHKSLFNEGVYPLIGVLIILLFYTMFKLYVNNFILCAVSILIYIGVLYGTGWIDSDDKNFVIKVINHLKTYL
ncbi:flippase [Methanococcoides burtonii]|uniref:Polysaccharide biosynthesis protein, membrane-associated n=1 Tax=Methanococcoides burtonii (strain DSM 6242 / NBRC 107633 / OCM 468 / ACE-M) TaxID=259564 RepID=Q12XY4_METBU|nr:flippase [Methanococcoides burtonii]ABE51692.1 Polysaccharide biosynthesis protein, membrane-associated [Methanococcoides burtonii DSM 6242]